MDRLLKQLAMRTGIDWILQAVTIYVDDIHIGCSFHNAAEFQLALRNVGHLLMWLNPGSHLQQTHGPLWTASQPTLRFLLQACMANTGCVCNPMANQQGHDFAQLWLNPAIVQLLRRSSNVNPPSPLRPCTHISG